jgi:hypothetical protein
MPPFNKNPFAKLTSVSVAGALTEWFVMILSAHFSWTFRSASSEPYE